jgi:hypothetical protein
MRFGRRRKFVRSPAVIGPPTRRVRGENRWEQEKGKYCGDDFAMMGRRTHRVHMSAVRAISTYTSYPTSQPWIRVCKIRSDLFKTPAGR